MAFSSGVAGVKDVEPTSLEEEENDALAIAWRIHSRQIDRSTR